MEKNLYIFAGVNGAGKSTLYNSEISTELKEVFNNSTRINTDEIVRTFGDWKNEADQIKAGKMAIKLRNECFKDGRSFNQETTLTGNSILKTIDKAKKLGYKVHLYYVGVDNPKLAKERVKNRVEKGGHNIPDEIIEKRYYESLENLKKVINKCDEIQIYDNTKNYKIICNINKKENIFLLKKETSEWAKEVINKLKLEKKIEKRENLKNLVKEISSKKISRGNYNTLTGNEIIIADHSSGDKRWLTVEDVRKHNIPIKENEKATLTIMTHKEEEKLYIKPIEYYNVGQLNISKEVEKQFKPMKEKVAEKSKEKGQEIGD